MNDDLLNDLILAASTVTTPMPEIRVLTLPQFAFEQHWPAKEVIIQPQIFMDGERLTIALDLDVLGEFTHEHVLHALLNLNEDINLTRLNEPCLFGSPIVLHWHDDSQTYVRGLSDVPEHEVI